MRTLIIVAVAEMWYQDVLEFLLSVCYTACVEPRDSFRMTVDESRNVHFDSHDVFELNVLHFLGTLILLTAEEYFFHPTCSILETFTNHSSSEITLTNLDPCRQSRKA